MKTLGNYFIPFLALLAIAASTVAWVEYRELAGLRAVTIGADERADLQKRVWDAQKRIKELETQLAGPPASRRGAAAELADAGAAGDHGPTGGGLASTILRRMNDPEAQRLLAEQMKAQIEHRYAGLFDRLNLAPDQLAQFKNLLVERQSAQFDILSAASDQGVTDPQDFQKLVASTQADIDSQIKSTVGDAAYTQFQGFQQTQAAQNTVNQLQASLSRTSAPLTPAQADQMTQVLVQTSPPPGNSTAGLGGNSSGLVTDTAVAQSQSILSAPQIQALQAIQQQQQAQIRLRQIILQNQPSGAAAGQGPGG